jgi:hypothetical protein
MVIGSLYFNSVGLRMGIGPAGGKALSSRYIWTFIPPTRPSIGQNQGRGRYIWTDGGMVGQMDRQMDRQTDG